MGLVKENLDIQKIRGGYYTPKLIAEFIANWAISKDTYRVLEPSCGDGNFIEAAILRFKELGVFECDLKGKIQGIELIEEEALKAKSRALQFGLNSTTIVNSDFFQFVKTEPEQKYDAVIGNPPFIRYQSFPEEHRILAIEMMKDLGLNPNKLTNIWVPFLVVSSALLSEKGKLGMVIPAELFQVKYAAETRVFLSKFFDRITIVTFKRLVFKGIQQEVVLLLCEKKALKNKGIRTIECKTLEDLNLIDFEALNGSNLKPIDHSTEKWTKYFLSEKEIKLLKKFKNDPRVIPCKDLLEVDVGIVTGRNQFFMLDESQVKKWGLKAHTMPVTSKSNQLAGCVFLEKDFEYNSEKQQSIYLFVPPNKDFKDLPKECQRYIEYGESQNFHTGYKCRIRKRWYLTPSLWIPEAFSLRQVAGYPKIVLNETSASSTDTIHRVKFKKGINKHLLTTLFYNSLSFAFSEITGRSYGGGVMTFEPTEIEDIRIPILKDVSVDIEQLDNLLRQKKIEKILDLIDEEFLVKKHGFSKQEVLSLREIWKKLSARRLGRTKKTA